MISKDKITLCENKRQKTSKRYVSIAPIVKERRYSRDIWIKKALMQNKKTMTNKKARTKTRAKRAIFKNILLAKFKFQY